MIFKLLRRFNCKHKWKFHSQVEIFDTTKSKEPIEKTRTIICNYCGKTKDIKT